MDGPTVSWYASPQEFAKNKNAKEAAQELTLKHGQLRITKSSWSLVLVPKASLGESVEKRTALTLHLAPVESGKLATICLFCEVRESGQLCLLHAIARATCKFVGRVRQSVRTNVRTNARVSCALRCSQTLMQFGVILGAVPKELSPRREIRSAATAAESADDSAGFAPASGAKPRPRGGRARFKTSGGSRWQQVKVIFRHELAGSLGIQLEVRFVLVASHTSRAARSALKQRAYVSARPCALLRASAPSRVLCVRVCVRACVCACVCVRAPVSPVSSCAESGTAPCSCLTERQQRGQDQKDH